jgi:hypothetical protein
VYETGRTVSEEKGAKKGKEKIKKKKGQKKRGGETTKKPRVRVSSLSPLDVQSALTDAAAVSHSDSVDVCGRITAKVFDARVSALAAKEKKPPGRIFTKKKKAYLVDERQVVVVGCHREHQPLFQVKRYFVRVPVLANERV